MPEVKKPLASGNLITSSLGDNFYSYTQRGTGAWARNDPPDPEFFVFSEVPPGPKPAPSIHAHLMSRFALLATKEEFENYDLVVWFRWGDKFVKGNQARQAAVLLHCTPGTEGQLGRGMLPQCIAVVLNEGQVGSLRVLGLEGAIKCKATVNDVPGRNQYVHDPGAPAKILMTTNASYFGRNKNAPKMNPGDWDGMIFRRGFKAEEYEDVRGKSLGPWTQMRIECSQGNVKVYVGSELTSEITDCTLTRGRIGLASLQAEWYIGKLEVLPRRK
jgi:hypothetical protein